MKPLHSYERYQRQILLKEFGETAQQKLLLASVLVIGAGGLGCPALQYLVAAGVGNIGIIDFDVVELSNLQRQTLFSVDDIGKPKATVAAQKLHRINPEINIEVYREKLTNKNAWDILSRYQTIIDGSDNFSTRYMVNDACVLLKKPLVFGAVLRFEGQVAVFNNPAEPQHPVTSYRDLFPNPPSAHQAPSCNEAGVIGVLPGIIGTLQAAEAIKIITGIGEPLNNQMLTYNVNNNSFFKFLITPSNNRSVTVPTDKIEFENFDYDWHCGIVKNREEVTADEFDELRREGDVLVIDVRVIGEVPAVVEFPFLHIPLSVIDQKMNEISNSPKIVFFCQSGKRGRLAIQKMQGLCATTECYSLQGGIEAWKKNQAGKTFNKA